MYALMKLTNDSKQKIIIQLRPEIRINEMEIGLNLKEFCVHLNASKIRNSNYQGMD